MQWYLLPTKQQKAVSTLIHWIQNCDVLTIGPFGDLDFETASTVSIQWILSTSNATWTNEKQNVYVIILLLKSDFFFSVNQIHFSSHNYASQCIQGSMKLVHKCCMVPSPAR